MITSTEIQTYGHDIGIHPSDVQRDYVYDWLLAGIYTISALKDVLILKGGNAFRKAYFPNARFSRDLDFSTQTELDERFLEQELVAVCRFVQEQTGVQFELDRTAVGIKQQIDSERIVYEARLYFHDFTGQKDSIVIRVKLDVVQFDRIYLPIQSRSLIHQFSDGDACQATVRCLKLEELLAAKLICLLQRRHSLDLFDLIFGVFINKDIAVDRGEILRTFLRKSVFEHRPGVAKALLLDLQFSLFEAVWEKYLICPTGSFIAYGDAVARFPLLVEEVFAQVITRRWDGTFYSGEQRATIMEAAARLVLLRIRYKSRERLVEPYSLTYKVTRENIGREYFYGWDRTGGFATPPGIRSYFSERIEGLEITDESFEPRFPVELSKSVETKKVGYFARPFSSGERTATRVRSLSPRPRKHTGTVYILQCAYCNKKFERTTRDTSLRAHKNPYGSPCHGRRGYVVNMTYR